MSCNLKLYSEKKNRALREKKKKYSNSCVEKQFLNETKNHNPLPLKVKWSVPKKHSFLQWQLMFSLLYITIWFTVTMYPYLKWPWILYFLRRFFSFLYHCQYFYQTWLYIWATQWVSYMKQELCTLHEHLSHPPVFGGLRVTHLSSFLCCYFHLLVSLLCLVPRLLCL